MIQICFKINTSTPFELKMNGFHELLSTKCRDEPLGSRKSDVISSA